MPLNLYAGFVDETETIKTEIKDSSTVVNNSLK